MKQSDHYPNPPIQPRRHPSSKPLIGKNTLWVVPTLTTLLLCDPALSQIEWDSLGPNAWPPGSRQQSFTVGCPGNQNTVTIQFTGNIPPNLPSTANTNIGPDGRSLVTAMNALDRNRQTQILITFATPVSLGNLRIHDVDLNDLPAGRPRNQVWVDEVEITANSGAVIPNLAPALPTTGIPAIPPPPYNPPFVVNNPPSPFPFRNGPGPNPIATGSAVVVNPNFPAGNVATGIGDGTNITAEGTITANFGSTLLNSIEIIYRNGAISPATNTEIQQQAISIGDITFANPCIAIAKAPGAVSETAPGVYTIPYTIRVRNDGNVPLTNVQATENFAQQFGLALGSAPLQLGQYRITAPPVVTGSLIANPNFNGSSDTNLLAPGSTLAVGADTTITTTVEVRPNPVPTLANPVVLNNQVEGSGSFIPPGGTPITVTDKSNNGDNPNPLNDGNPSGPGKDIPTRVPLPPTAIIPGIIGVAKQAGTPQTVAGQTGVFDIPYTIRVENSGTLNLSNIQIDENFAAPLQPVGVPDPIWSSLTHTPSATPAQGQYTIIATPVTTGTLTANGGFTGSGANTGLLNPATSNLAIGAAGTITFTVRVHPNPALLPGNLNNQVRASGTDTNGNAVEDRSVNGAIPDADGNLDPRNDQGPSPVPLQSVPPPPPPRIGVAKGVGLPRSVGNGLFDVPYTIRVQNYGGVDLTNVQVEENFAAAVTPPGAPDPAWSSLTYTANPNPSPGQYTVSGAPNATGTLTGNPTFTGSVGGSINLLDATGSTLAIGQSELINFVVRIAPVSLPIFLNNQVRASGIDPNNPNNPVTDTSVDDANTPTNPNPDPNGDSDPTDNTTPTPVRLPPGPTPRIGVAKSVTSATDVTPNDPSDGLFDVNYTILVSNMGNVDLTNVQLDEDFASQFGLNYTPSAPGIGQYTLLAPPTTAAPLTANGGFTGSGANTGLLNPAASTLAIAQQQTLTVGVRVNIDPLNLPFILDNQVQATGNGGGQQVSDLSEDGTNGANPNDPNPDSDGDGDPGNNNTPTRVSLPIGQPIPRIGTAKAVNTNNIVDLGNGRFNVPYTIIVENAGTDNLNNVQVTENFEAADPLGFGLTYVPGAPGPGQYTLIGTPSTSSPLSINPAFTGSSGGSINLLNAASSNLPIGQSRDINFIVQVFPASIPVTLNNQANASGTGAASRRGVTDNSVDGLDTSPGSGLNPNRAGGPTSVILPPFGSGTGGDFVLVKRITGVTRNGQAIPGLDLSRFVDDPNDGNDNQLNGTSLSPVGLVNVEGLQSGDEVEYTVYYLAGGKQAVTNARVCDLVPERTTFIPNSFGGESGILLRQGTTETAQTNVGDGDGGQFFSPLAPVNAVIPPCPTNTVNPDGAVFVQLGNIPNVGPDQTGFVRFRVRLD